MSSGQRSAFSHQQSAFSHQQMWLLALVLGILAACTPSTPTPAVGLPSVMPKLLATVYISPTPNPLQLEATRTAQPPSVTPPPVQPTMTATPYVGAFLGEVESDSGPIINPADFVFSPPTEAAGSAILANCLAQPDPLFSNRWMVETDAVAALGCPTELLTPFIGALQIFERGVMYWRPNGEIWAVATGEGRYWYVSVALPPPPGEIAAPEGLLLPSQSFITAWRSVEGLSAAIGFARTQETQASLSFQRFQGGLLFSDGGSGQVFILLADFRAFGPY